MFTALYNGVNGVKSQSHSIDNTANNISNVNTIGFKYSEVGFKDVFYSTMTTQSYNKDQIGYGASAASATDIFEQGPLEATDGEFDVAIAGKGFFGISNGNSVYYTRNGAFRPDANGNLVDANGNYVLGTMNPSLQEIQLSNRVSNMFGQQLDQRVTTALTGKPGVDFPMGGVNTQGPISVPKNLYLPPQPTQNITWSGNLDTSTKTEAVNIDLDVEKFNFKINDDGTKLKVAFLTDKHDTVGIDCVAMCVNDILCVGAKPLFFLDYIAVGKNYPEKVANIVKGVAEGCIQSEAALIGGETAEMPGFYPEDEYDLAGFAVGVVDKSKILKKETVEAGDVIIGLPSSGVHSNGFSLVRKVLDIENEDITTPLPELGNKSIGETLLTPTKIYVKPMLKLFEEVNVKSVAHITGGGFYENIPRSLPKGMGAKIQRENVRVLPIFDLVAKRGNIPERDMFNTFNMGVGMTVVVAREDVEKALEVLHANGEDAYVLGEVTAEEGVEIC